MSKIILTWTFKKVPHIVSTYIDTTENVLKYCHPKSPPKSNLVPAEKYLYTATNKDDIIITKTDEDGAVAVWDVEDYTKEANKCLIDKSNYKNDCKILRNALKI